MSNEKHCCASCADKLDQPKPTPTHNIAAETLQRPNQEHCCEGHRSHDRKDGREQHRDHKHECRCGGHEHHHHHHDGTHGHEAASSCECECGCGHEHGGEESLKPRFIRILVALALFVAATALIELGYAAAWSAPFDGNALVVEFMLYLIPYLLAGYDVILGAFRNIGRGQVFGEDLLMTIATFGAFALVLFPESEPHMAEGAAVMLFFQVGELFQDYAVGKSRKSIAGMMDIAPEFANIMQKGGLVQVSPHAVKPGDEFVVKPGERIPLDGVVIAGASQVDAAALTGESLPRPAETGSDVISGCVNLTGTLTVRATKPYEDSTVSRILELVEKASDRKARSESFITRFARWYTPAVVIVAALLAIAPPLLAELPWADWVQRGLIFLVVSCPCALVISVPLSFFGGIGGASRLGILVKGSNYLEALAQVDTVVFDKTGTLTSGNFKVVEISPEPGCTREELLALTAHAEGFSTHPIAASIREACETIDLTLVDKVEELGGHGVSALVGGRQVLVGNAKLMESRGVHMPSAASEGAAASAVVYVAVDGVFLGSITVADAVKPDAAAAISALRRAGVPRTIMLTGDRAETAESVAQQLGISEVRANLLPQDKVTQVEAILSTQEKGRKLAFVGDGINDAPVLMRADVGIAMGAIGSDAAIEAADVVLMNDKPSDIARAVGVARKTMRIVRQNIVFALGVKFAVLALAAFGIANLWLAVFADVGVAVLAILNAMRAMRV